MSVISNHIVPKMDILAIVLLNLSLTFFFFFNDTATTEIYTLSLHDALPICGAGAARARHGALPLPDLAGTGGARGGDRKSTRLNSSHLVISYAVFCLKKKNKNTKEASKDTQ